MTLWFAWSGLPGRYHIKKEGGKHLRLLSKPEISRMEMTVAVVSISSFYKNVLYFNTIDLSNTIFYLIGINFSPPPIRVKGVAGRDHGDVASMTGCLCCAAMMKVGPVTAVAAREAATFKGVFCTKRAHQ